MLVFMIFLVNVLLDLLIYNELRRLSMARRIFLIIYRHFFNKKMYLCTVITY